MHLSRPSQLLLTVGILATSLTLSAQTATPGYNSPWRNGDGSSKLALAFGGGYDISAGATRQHQSRGWNYLMAGGYNLNHVVGMTAEYAFNHFEIPQTSSLGDVHLWSLTLEPTVHYFQTEHYGGYVLIGGGFYRKLTVFRDPAGDCPILPPISVYNCPSSPNEAQFSNNAGGLNLATGFAWASPTPATLSSSQRSAMFG